MPTPTPPKPILTVKDIIERAVTLIMLHPSFQDPLVFNAAGEPIRLTRILAGHEEQYDINPNGVTLSLYPYAYVGGSNETVGSRNVALAFKPYTLGSKVASDAFDLATLTLVVKLQTMGTEMLPEEKTSHGIKTVIVRSFRENILHEWLPILRAILLTNPIADLAGLVMNSTVDWGTYHSVKKEGGPSGKPGENLVFHNASLLWSINFIVPRDWKMYQQRITAPNVSDVSSWTYVGLRMRDFVPIYWDALAGSLVTATGFAVPSTPKGQRVVWDLGDHRFETPEGTALNSTQLEDPTLSPTGPWIRTDLVIVGVVVEGNSRWNLYWNTTTQQFQKADGTIVTQLPSGTPIVYDPETGQVLNGNTGDPLGRTDEFFGLHTGQVNIFEANGLELRDKFTF